MTAGALLVLGTSSGAGKTTLVTGLCRALLRRGMAVAPFKAQNMSLNSAVTLGGEEIARAQAAQAFAAGVEPEVAMNPVLLKPGSDASSQLVVMGHPVGELESARFADRAQLLEVVLEAFEDLRGRFTIVVCEGAGSPAEINLRRHDIVNLGFARAAHVPAILVGDIDRGGVFASFAGTLALLSGEDQDLVHGFAVNRFRGDAGLLEPALETTGRLLGRPVLGVLPYRRGLGLDAEDAPDPEWYLEGAAPVSEDVLRVGVIRLPRASNLTDLDPLAAEPGVIVRFVTRPEELADADLVVLPGTRTTVADLSWLRSNGFGTALARRAAGGLPILGICGGYQILGSEIDDTVESSAGIVAGLGLLPVRTTFEPEKVLARPVRQLADGTTVSGYEIHHGQVRREGGEPFVADEGCRTGGIAGGLAGTIAGTSWHGLFENDVFRRRYLEEVAAMSGRRFVAAPGTVFADRRNARAEVLADLVEEHLPVDRLLDIALRPAPLPPRLRLLRQEPAERERTVELVAWQGPVRPDDPDANFKSDVALYAHLDPMTTIGRLAEAMELPEGALVRYVLAKWASAGSGGLLELGPSMVHRLWAAIESAELAGTGEARLAGYEQLRQMISWLRLPLVEEGPDSGY